MQPGKFPELWIILLLVVHAHPAAAGENPNLTDRMARAGVLSSLDVAGLQPWHLKLTVSQFDEKGNAEEQGTVEEWWGSPDKKKIVYQTAGYSTTEIHNERGVFQSLQGKSRSLLVTELIDQVVHPLPVSDEVTSSKPELRTQNLGKVRLDCIMLSQPIKSGVPAPFGLFPTYCFDPGKDSLRASYNLGSQTVIRNGLGKFQDRLLAMDTAIVIDGVVRARGHVEALSGGSAAVTDFEDETGLEANNRRAARIGAGVMAGTILSKEQPTYPEAARAQRIQGTVVLRAIIGRDGRIQRLQLASIPDPNLAIAALAAVRHWTYKPYLLDGEPVEVDTTITVNFNFAP